jgi:hypothetical protein
VDDSTQVIAVAAAAVGVVALVWALFLTVQVRRLRAAQTGVLGEHGARDLVTHAAELDEAFRNLRDHVDVVHGAIDERLAEVEARLDGAIAYRALVRFDAYNELSGRQSTSIALLDAHGSGVVLTSIHHREAARLYAKQVHEGRGELELAPEEEEAVRLALSAPAPTA